MSDLFLFQKWFDGNGEAVEKSKILLYNNLNKSKNPYKSGFFDLFVTNTLLVQVNKFIVCTNSRIFL